MRVSSMTPELTERAFAILRDLIHDRTGLHYDNGKRELLADKLFDRLLACGFESFMDYYYLLKYDAAAEGEWRHLQDALAVPETYFWREMDQIRALVDIIVPQHFSSHSPLHPLRIWCAACCTGEEPLTIALALDEAGWLGRVPIEIRASDASGLAIEKARMGFYRDRSFRALPENLRARYFLPGPAGWRIDPKLHARVTWMRANLMAPAEIADFAVAEVGCDRRIGKDQVGETGFLGRFAAGRGRSGRCSSSQVKTSPALFPKNRSAAVVPSSRLIT